MQRYGSVAEDLDDAFAPWGRAKHLGAAPHAEVGALMRQHGDRSVG